MRERDRPGGARVLASRPGPGGDAQREHLLHRRVGRLPRRLPRRRPRALGSEVGQDRGVDVVEAHAQRARRRVRARSGRGSGGIAAPDDTRSGRAGDAGRADRDVVLEPVVAGRVLPREIGQDVLLQSLAIDAYDRPRRRLHVGPEHEDVIACAGRERLGQRIALRRGDEDGGHGGVRGAQAGDEIGVIALAAGGQTGHQRRHLRGYVVVDEPARRGIEPAHARLPSTARDRLHEPDVRDEVRVRGARLPARVGAGIGLVIAALDRGRIDAEHEEGAGQLAIEVVRERLRPPGGARAHARPLGRAHRGQPAVLQHGESGQRRRDEHGQQRHGIAEKAAPRHQGRQCSNRRRPRILTAGDFYNLLTTPLPVLHHGARHLPILGAHEGGASCPPSLAPSPPRD